MYQNSQGLSPPLQKMIFEMELRGYAQHTKDHYLGHLSLLEKHTNKSALKNIAAMVWNIILNVLMFVIHSPLT